jgi:multidrug efflux pump subunit AcrB
MAHMSDQELIEKKHNTERFFTKNKHVAWVLLALTIVWGIYGFLSMPKRKDPDIPVRVAAALVYWPGASAENLEDRATRVVERSLAQNSHIEKIESTTRAGVAVVTIKLDKAVTDTSKEFDDIWLKLQSINELPDGAFMQFIKDFGDTSALMLTIASPRASAIEVQLRGDAVAAAIRAARTDAPSAEQRAALVVAFPYSLDDEDLLVLGRQLALWAESRGARDVRVFSGRGFLGIDSATSASDEKILESAREFARERLRATEIHPDVWRPVVIRDPADSEAKLAAVAGEKYSYRDLDRYSEQLEKALQAVPEVARVTRSGVVGDVVYLDYSQERLAGYGIAPAGIQQALAERNVTARGGVFELQGKSVLIAPEGELQDEAELGGIVVSRTPSGAPVYLRDLVTIYRGYESSQYLSYATWRDAEGNWQRTRAITLALTMKAGLQIATFGEAVQQKIDTVRQLLPEDLVVSKVSDQPQQVEENVSLFMSSLYEAIILVVVVALIGFWDWRSALLLALSIPITLAMTFGMMRLLGLDVQQVSIASLIIALGLLVDVPVVAGDAIKRELGRGLPARIAAWLGPTKLANAMLYATITNIVAYLPFLLLTGDTGQFIYSLPVVLTASLVASRLVSMTFVPLLGLVLMRPPKTMEPTAKERRTKGFPRLYSRLIERAIQRRWLVLGGFTGLFALGVVLVRDVKQSFFPTDHNYLSYVEVWLPEDSPVSATRESAEEVERVIRELGGSQLDSLTTFVGGGGPRFWFSIAPEQRQSNYAQLLIRMKDKHDTAHFVAPLQDALSRQVAGARIDVREIETGPGVGVPVAIRVSGDDPVTLRALAARVTDALERQPKAERVHDSWGASNFTVKLKVDADRASAAGVTTQDVMASSAFALNGAQIGALQEGDHKVPIIARLRASERQRLSDVENLYVHSAHDPSARVPLRHISDFDFGEGSAKILRRNHARTITVGAFPTPGHVPSEVLADLEPELAKIRSELPPGYSIDFGGEKEEQTKTFFDLVVVLIMSVVAIFVALVLQFRNAAKPLIVFAAIPFGVVAALASLHGMGAPFGFMAFLGVISLIGVIVSHVIVLFDFIEEQHEAGANFLDALIDAGVLRLRPVVVTVGATVLGLVPLALHGGPLWEPLCYVQIGGLTFATVVTLVLVPVLYAIFVLDLKLVTWDTPAPSRPSPSRNPHRLTPSLAPAAE